MNAPLVQPLYDEVQHGTWSTLYRRQRENLEDRGARLYLNALDRMESLGVSRFYFQGIYGTNDPAELLDGLGI